MVQIKRVYESDEKNGGYRILIDRLWPRGIRKDDLAIDEWLKDIAPSSRLRKSFAHNPIRWKSFVSAYKQELKDPESQKIIKKLARLASKSILTLLYSARDEEHNNAVVLKHVIEREMTKLKR